MHVRSITLHYIPFQYKWKEIDIIKVVMWSWSCVFDVVRLQFWRLSFDAWGFRVAVSVFVFWMWMGRECSWVFAWLSVCVLIASVCLSVFVFLLSVCWWCSCSLCSYSLFVVQVVRVCVHVVCLCVGACACVSCVQKNYGQCDRLAARCFFFCVTCHIVLVPCLWSSLLRRVSWMFWLPGFFRFEFSLPSFSHIFRSSNFQCGFFERLWMFFRILSSRIVFRGVNCAPVVLCGV